MSRALLRSILELRTPAARLPPSYLLPLGARFLSQTPQNIEATRPTIQSSLHQPQSTKPSAAVTSTIAAAAAAASATATITTTTTASSSPTTIPEGVLAPGQPATPLAPTSLDPSVRTLLPLLASQPGHYVTVHIHAKPYLVTAGDRVRLPFKMPGAVPGDVLRLNRASVLGSRDLTLRGAPYLDERLFECRAVVLGTESEPMRVLIKKKQRTRRKKHVRSKHKYTMLRISELKVNRLDEVEA